jgi:hypothetical protein
LSDKLFEFGRIEIVSDEHRFVGVPPTSQCGQSVSLSPKQTAIDQRSAQTPLGVELVTTVPAKVDRQAAVPTEAGDDPVRDGWALKLNPFRERN